MLNYTGLQALKKDMPMFKAEKQTILMIEISTKY